MDKYLSKIQKTNKCWNWTGEIRSGYGRVWANGKNNQAHRLIYELLIEKIPVGLQLDHLCRNRKCVNPKHLEPVTNKENIRRAQPFIKRKTHCKNGHKFIPENTTRRNENDKSRVCRLCKNNLMREFMRNKRSTTSTL